MWRFLRIFVRKKNKMSTLSTDNSFILGNPSFNWEVKITQVIGATYNSFKHTPVAEKTPTKKTFGKTASTIVVDKSHNKLSEGIKSGFYYALAILLIIVGILILPITYPIAFFLYKDLAKKISKNRENSLNKIRNASFDRIKEMEMDLDKMLTIFKPFDFTKTKDNLLFKPIVKNYMVINSNLNEFKQECKRQYSFSKEDMLKYLTEEEFEEYKKTFASFNDIWDYPTSDKEYQSVFNHKKSIP